MGMFYKILSSLHKIDMDRHGFDTINTNYLTQYKPNTRTLEQLTVMFIHNIMYCGTIKVQLPTYILVYADEIYCLSVIISGYTYVLEEYY